MMPRAIPPLILVAAATLLSFSVEPLRADILYVDNASNGMIERFDSLGSSSVFVADSGGSDGLAFDSVSNLYAASFDNTSVLSALTGSKSASRMKRCV